jgi:predicted methyltransferase
MRMILMKSEHLIPLRILKLIPDDRWLSAAKLAELYRIRYNSDISVPKVVTILDYLFSEGLITHRKRRRSWGLLTQYSGAEPAEPDDPSSIN